MAGDPKPLSIELSDKSLRLECVWQQDRFTHRLIDDQGQQADSVQGTADQDWPPSPPLQQLSLEDINGFPTILGVGAAGVSHWSVSVQETLLPCGTPAFKFEFACRTKAEPEWLGSSYSRNGGIVIESDSGCKSVESSSKTTPEAESTPAAVLAISAANSTAETVQWSYFAYKRSSE